VLLGRLLEFKFIKIYKMLNCSQDTAYSLDFFTGFRQIRVINHEAYRILVLAGIRPDCNFPNQLKIDPVKYFSPIKGTIGHKAVENILLARENLKQNEFRIMKSVFDHE